MRRISALTALAVTLAIMFAVAFLLATIFSVTAQAEPAVSHPVGQIVNPYRDPGPGQAVIDVDKGIRFVLEASPCWGLAANDTARRDMAAMIVEASKKNDVPALLLTVMAKRESSFSPDAIGSARGEVGLLQVHGLAAKGCDLETPEGQLSCGARWLRLAYDKCGTWEQAIAAYAAGYCVAPKDSKLFRLVFSRYRQWQKALAVIEGCNSGHADHWVCQPRQDTCVDAIRVIARAGTSKNGHSARVPGLQAP
jgi:soluble lytic murein transglycosylase-like protein